MKDDVVVMDYLLYQLPINQIVYMYIVLLWFLRRFSEKQRK